MKTLIEVDVIHVNDIDDTDHCYRISDERDDRHLERSIQSFGILTPPLLVRKEKGFRIVSGFRRIGAFQKMGGDRIPVRVIREADDLTCVQLAILENAGERQLGVSEQIRAVRLLAPFFPEPQKNEEFFKRACTVLMLPENRKYIIKLICVTALVDKLFDLVVHERLSLDVAVELAGLDDATQMGYFPFFSEYKMSLSKQKEFILMTREIAARETRPLCEVLAETLQNSLAGRDVDDSNARLAGIRHYLYERRYPEMTRIMKTYDAFVAGLKLPDGMKLVIPDALEGRAYQLRIMFETLDDLKKYGVIINELVGRPEMATILSRETVHQEF
ncbi:hypothetical protein JCM14469_03950 [Desulfatiferula olefinivorans]